MSDQPVFNGIDLEEFLATAGRSFTDAQRGLVQGSAVSATMMLSSAELELKVAVGTSATGRMLVNPISSQDIARGGIDPGMLSTLRINLISSIGDSFDDIPRTGNPAPAGTGGATKRIPDLTGLTVEESIARLKAGQWKFEAHAAPREEIAQAAEGSQGKVLRQEPAAAAVADPNTDTVHFWMNLGNVPVAAIDGIGDKLAKSLETISIRSVGELSLADAGQLATLLHIGKARAQDFVTMAALMARLTVLGLKDEVVELLVKGVGIRSLGELAAADPAALHQQCRAALDAAAIRSPKTFKITAESVAEWVKAAAREMRGT